MATQQPPLLRSSLPAVTAEIRALLEEFGEVELAAQVEHLRIVDRCRCDDETCSTFYTVPKPNGSWDPSLKCVELPAETGMMILDIVAGQISMVEILDRPDTRKQLMEVCP